ncbi:hypothetical protein TSOC_004508 [Tetrabaena socialis]|uniref:Right handed beta helix domain-containing protein n=1 Tax=Tetrabaena socialis TaxID=47790 RepID=A0A2J8A8N4_9CHLO|nr:hypothetical protein TSOC_004508 [Tetrabaena socialis]|eukprot:PNH08902.1 hypothetical protein TSOC_004508 [Tetrabaena socialis]
MGLPWWGLAAAVLLGCCNATVNTVTFITGRTMTPLGGNASVYNSTLDTSITTQYNDTWNYNNGVTYWWNIGSDGWYTLGEWQGMQFRTLLRFANVHQYVKSTSVVKSAQLSVTFLNWGPKPVLVQPAVKPVPFLRRCFAPLPRSFNSTGWRFSGWVGNTSVPWTSPGGWADCSSKVNISFVVDVNGQYGYVSKTIALDARSVQGWLSNNGTANYGLLFRAINGSISLVHSQASGGLLRRPALSLSFDSAEGPPAVKYPVTLTTVPRIWWVDTAGNDEVNSGHSDSPFKSPAKAVFEAWPGDLIYLKNGVYPGAFNIWRSNITLQSAPGEWAVVSSPMTDPQEAVNVITLRPGANYGVIQNLEISGGFYYGIFFFTSWENYGTMAERVAKGAGPRNWLISNVRIHDTGSSGVKLSMKAINNTFANCEIFNTGARLRTGGHGIEAVQAYTLTVRDCYLHDIPAAGVHLAGGTARALLERNYVARTNFGFNLGFATDAEYMDTINNPALHESINATVRNNIITAVGMAGINIWASRGVVVAHNTIWQAQENAQDCILVNSYNHAYTPAGPILTSCANLTIWANVLVRSASARAGPVFQIRAAGLDPATPLVMAHNVYYDQKGVGPVPFQWGHGAMLEDERENSIFVGNATGWAKHCTADLAKPNCDINSLEADPLLSAAFAPLSCSPALARAPPSLAGVVLAALDFHNRVRPAGQLDAGAVQANASGAVKALPPAFPAFLGRPPFMGIGPGPVYDKLWPYDFWQTRTCKDLLVDAVNGTDNQTFNYNSTYVPFKTIQVALININQCDRILLKGGQNHTGGFGIYRPNVTITTNPADLNQSQPTARAVVVCPTTGALPCIRTGEGLYGGAAAINLYGFDVVMGGATSGSCIHLNEGSGSGTSSYWAFYLAQSGRAGPKVSYIKDMTMTNCGLHGIKFSTFVRDVVVQDVSIISPKAAGIEVRGGRDLTFRSNKIISAAETAIRLGGGVRNVLVEKNLIKNFGSRGILLGSDNTEVMYMDVDWARAQSPASWHDNINTTVKNNVIDGGAGAGISFYSARDAVVVHNTLLGVAATMQAGVLLNLSPKLLGPTQEVAAPNTNITFKNNIVVLGGGADNKLMDEARIMQGTILNKQLAVSFPNSTCPLVGHHHRMLRGLVGERAAAVATATTAAAIVAPDDASDRAIRRQLVGQSFADAYVKAPGEQGRNPDGSCPMFPADHAWHRDVSLMPVHPNSDSIKTHIGGGNLHADFAGGMTVNGKRVLYGIPFITVDTSKGTPLVPITIGPNGYPGECDTSPSGFPFPATAPVEGAYLNCPDASCGGDRHVLVVDNATCLLYETWRSFPPALVASGKWQVDIIARFNLSRNALGRPLGWTSSDAAGLAVLPGLVKWDEVVNKKVIDHAIRFTGPNSRQAYAPPATHFAAAGYPSPDAPYMGMRTRLKATYDCSPLKPAARVFCVALQKYGAIFADNGSPWYFTGEATANWDAVLTELYDIATIPSSAMEVLDSGCLCLDSDCTVAECGGVQGVDPNALPVYPSIANVSSLKFANNIYYKAGATGRYVDRRTPPLGAAGYDGVLAGWKTWAGEAGSVEVNPALNRSSYKPLQGSPALNSVPRLPGMKDDFYGKARSTSTSTATAGAALP